MLNWNVTVQNLPRYIVWTSASIIRHAWIFCKNICLHYHTPVCCTNICFCYHYVVQKYAPIITSEYVTQISVSTITISEYVAQMSVYIIITPECNELPELSTIHSTSQPKLSELSLGVLCSTSPPLYLKQVKKKKSIKFHGTAKGMGKAGVQ